MAFIIAPELYSRPPIDPVPGSRVDYRKMTFTTAQLVNGNVIAFMPLPAFCLPMEFFLEVSGAMDSGNTATIDIGLLNSYYNKPIASATYPGGVDANGQLDGATITALDTGTSPGLVSGKNMLTSSTIIRAGGRIDYSALAYCLAITPSKWTRIIALKITAAVGTAVAGTIALGVQFDAVQYDS